MNFNVGNMLEQVKKMQSEMEKVKGELNQKVVSAESGGGMVKVKVTGANQLIEINIAPELMDPNETKMLEDLIIAAVNKGLNNAQEMVGNEMGKLTGMLPNIPGLNFNL